MPDPTPRDYTAGELAEGADLFREASDLLRPASDVLSHAADELMRSAKETGDTERGDQAVHVARSARHLMAIALHLKGGELTLTRLSRDAGRSHHAIRSWLLGLTFAAFGVSTVLGLIGLLPGHLAHVLGDAARGPAYFGAGVATANYIVWRRTRSSKKQ